MERFYQDVSFDVYALNLHHIGGSQRGTWHIVAKAIRKASAVSQRVLHLDFEPSKRQEDLYASAYLVDGQSRVLNEAIPIDHIEKVMLAILMAIEEPYMWKLSKTKQFYHHDPRYGKIWITDLPQHVNNPKHIKLLETFLSS